MDLVPDASDRPSPVVRLEGLVKRFPERLTLGERIRRPFHREWFEALGGVSLEVRPGELFGLLGPNGAGKTTLLKILSTLILPDEGTAEVAGHDVRTDPARVRSVLTPVIADERSLSWRLSAEANLDLYAALYGVPPDRRARRIRELLERVGLDDTGERLVGAFSSGMKQRLLVARALLSHPRVLILDEPTRSLDPVSARDLRDFIRTELVEREGCAVILATHNTEEAFGLCDRLAVLHHGKVVARGTSDELAHRAGRERCRIVVRREQLEATRVILADVLVHGGPRTTADHEPLPPELETSEVTDRETGWVALEVKVPGEAARAADIVRRLAAEDVDVAEFARLPVPLAELIERLVARVDG